MSNPRPFKPPSIADEGLKNYLDRTSFEHNGKNYNDFIEMASSPIGYSKNQVARAFGVAKNTVLKWFNVYDKEQSDGR